MVETAGCRYYEENRPGLALMDADPPHVRRCPRCDEVVVQDGDNWTHLATESS